jgi:post-segregation antitoxin (ccd killing protein)
MAKSRTNISIDSELQQKAKERFINISGLAEEAIKNKLSEPEVTRGDYCEFCGRKEPKAFVGSTGKYHDGLTWLNPDWKWICSVCMKNKERKIILKKSSA